jgi:hypothetical protein
MSNVSNTEIQRIRQGLNDLGDAIHNLATQEPPQPQIGNRSLSGDKIHGGKITRFQSVGIKDDSTRLVVLVNDDGIVTDNLDVETLVGDTTVAGDLNVKGHIQAESLHVNEVTADIRQERSSPLEFVSSDEDKIYGKGLLFRDSVRTRQLTLQPGPDRFFASEPIDLHREAYLSIGGISVLDESQLGTTVTKSNLRQVGTLQELKTQGNLTVDEFIFWNSDYTRLGFGTESPNGMLGLVQDGAEFIVDIENEKASVGTYTTSDFAIITDNTPRISISSTGKIEIGVSSDTKTTVRGKLGVNVNTPNADIATAGPVEFEGKRFEVSSEPPTSGVYKKGDIVWNTDVKPTGFVGWICVREGSPGVWKTFGQISE